MQYHAPKSTCTVCNEQFERKGIRRHIKSCLGRHIVNPPKKKSTLFHCLHVADTVNPDYFLVLLVKGNARLGDLDAFLRAIWLECCGHLSSFTGKRYGSEIPINRSIRDTFKPGTKLYYQYDFGSTTELVISFVDHYTGVYGTNETIQLIARNTQPIIPCDTCSDHPAAHICTECLWDGKGFLCEHCFAKHPCDEEMSLPVLNSPRTGVCAYGGT